jgi:hypothetical protein
MLMLTRYDYNLTIMKSQVSQPGHWQPVYKINQKLPLKSNNVEFLRYCSAHFKNGDR